MNLSVSDLMFCCFNLPLATSTFWYGSWMHGPLLCRLFPLLRYGLVAVSLFTVLAITINRYVMIGHPRLYPKLYKPKYLVLMVLATWISGFGALVATWFEQWGRFGLDPAIGSCSILPDVNGRSPKEFLFILAFLTPCIAIVVCYARIFYIVRKTARKSRRRDKATTDLALMASLEVRYTKNLEDSAIGSSFGATLTTTTEDGGSPTKHRDKNNITTLNSWKIVENDAKRTNFPHEDTDRRIIETTSVQLRNLRLSLRDVFPRDTGWQEETSPNDAEMNLFLTESRSMPIERNLNFQYEQSDIPASRVHAARMTFDEDLRTNFERSVEFLPFIDTHAGHERSQDGEADSAPSNRDGIASNLIPNLRFFKADSPSARIDNKIRTVEEIANDRKDCCLQVPKGFSRCSEKSANSVAQTRAVRTDTDKFEASQRRQILNTESLTNDENGLPSANKFLRKFEHNDAASDEYASSRSEAMTERQGSARKTNISRRESRFRSVRNRAYESGKMTAKDKKLLKMILVIFSSFLVCYLPITITKICKDLIDLRGLNVAGYILIYLTTCINPVIYVVMSSEYRCAYKNVLLCRSDSAASTCKKTAVQAIGNSHKRRVPNVRNRKNSGIK